MRTFLPLPSAVRSTCGADHLAALAGMQLDVVDLRTDRDIGERQAVADLRFRSGAVHDGHAVGQAFGGEDVGLLTVCVADQCDVGAAVRIVLDADDRCRDAVLISLEIDDSVFSVCAAAVMTDGDLALVVASRILLQDDQSDFSGVVFVISEKSEPVICLLEGVYGLYVLIPIVFLLSFLSARSFY